MDPWEAVALEQRRLMAAVQRAVQETLQLELPPSPDRPLGELGLDSLAAQELRRKLEQLVDRPLSATLPYDRPTVRELTRALLGR